MPEDSSGQTAVVASAPKASPGDVGTRLAHERTDLAMDRSYLAAERTLMAWIRTALSMISFGFTIAKLGQAMHDVELRKLLGGIRVVGVQRIGYCLVVLGTLALFGALLQHWHRVRELHAMGLRRQISITLIVGILLVILGGLAFTSLVTAL
jgi:putative membrane protein